MTIKAIQTRYKGYRFRSRLEARWAVFLERLGLQWEYEKEGCALPSGCYLPDFWLPNLECWVEIKPTAPNGHESNLAYELAKATNRKVFVFSGVPPGHDEGVLNSGEVFTAGPSWDNRHAFCVCTTCGSVGIQFDGRSDRMPCKECHQCAYYQSPGNGHFDGADIYKGHCDGKCPRSKGGNLDRGHTNNHPRILEAVKAARSARFEHGETPQ